MLKIDTWLQEKHVIKYHNFTRNIYYRHSYFFEMNYMKLLVCNNKLQIKCNTFYRSEYVHAKCLQVKLSPLLQIYKKPNPTWKLE